MSILLKEIKRAHPTAVSTLEKAGIRTDSDIQSLTRDDLRDLFPDPSHFKMRRSIFEIICDKQRPINNVLKELKGFIPEESFRAALTNNGVLVDYLNILKSVKSQMDNVQSFLDAHIDLLDISKTGQEPDKGFGTSTSTSTSTPAPRGSMESHNDQKHGRAQETHGAASGSSQSHATSSVGTSKDKSEGHPQGAYGKSSRESAHQYKEVRYQTAVSGQTFDTHLQLMDNVKARVKDGALLTECCQDGDVVILFCPNSSRVGTDVTAAMANNSVSIGDKPVILVLMHYTREVKVVTPQKTWPDYPNVVLHVNIFYHDAMPVRGLLSCQENDNAVCEIQNKLLEYSVLRTKYNSENQRSVTPDLYDSSMKRGPCTDTDNMRNSTRKIWFWK